jgi:hypothetical protein
MADAFEECRDNLTNLISWYGERKANRNEATTRFHLIDSIFFECLNWEKEDVVLEEPHGRGYADYVFYAPRGILVVEAKREGDYFELPIGINRIEYAVKSLTRDYPNLNNALEQVAGYCQTSGIPFGVVCNGHQIVAFVATRDDGISPFDGKAFVFSSLEHMLDNFAELWNSLSKDGIQEKHILKRLIGQLLPELPPKLSLSISYYPGIKGRNEFQTDLQIVSEEVIEDIAISRDLERTFLEECYCQSGALSQYSLISKSILQARYAALFDTETPPVTTIPATDKNGISHKITAESFSKRPIILIGDTGVGKTTFIRYLINVAAAPIFEKAITFYIDLGSQATLTHDLNVFILDEIARQLREEHGIEIEERNFVRGVYNIELQRFRKGIYADLFETNPSLFREKEIEYLENKVADRAQHLRNIVLFLSKGWKKQVILFIDNADQRDEDVQQKAFLISQEIAQHWPATVYVSIRPETFQRSVKIGALSGYHPKAFLISPPRIDRVIEKRLAFAKKLTSGEIPIMSLSDGISVHLICLDTIIDVFLDSIARRDDIIKFVDNISGGNVRLALSFIKQFFGSGHVDTKKIIDIYEETGDYLIPLHEFERAVIYGDAEYYDPYQSPIANIFDVTKFDPKEHFLMPLAISYLEALSSFETNEGFVETKSLYDRLQGHGFTPNQIDSAIIRACQKRLIETVARRIPQPGQELPPTLRITSIGIYHVKELCKRFPYYDAIIVDTPIFDLEVRSLIHDETRIERRLERAEKFRQYLDSQWPYGDSQAIAFDWNSVSSSLKRNIEYIWTRLT